MEIEVERMWGLKTTTVPVVMGALSTIKKDIENYTNKIPDNIIIHELQKMTPYSSPSSQAGPLHHVDTVFASQSTWFGLGC